MTGVYYDLSYFHLLWKIPFFKKPEFLPIKSVWNYEYTK